MLTECILTTSCWNFLCWFKYSTSCQWDAHRANLMSLCFPVPKKRSFLLSTFGDKVAQSATLVYLRVPLSSSNLLLYIYTAILLMFFSPLGGSCSRNSQEYLSAFQRLLLATNGLKKERESHDHSLYTITSSNKKPGIFRLSTINI